MFSFCEINFNNSDQIKRVMDAGAMGIIVPMVKSNDDIKKLPKVCIIEER